MPTPTHSRYYSRDPKRLDPGVLPWVSMADALGWGMDARPSMTVCGGGTDTGGAEPFGNGSRVGMRRELAADRWTFMGAGKTGLATPRDPHLAPAHTLLTKGTAAWVAQARNSGPGAERAPRPKDSPSYTIRANGSGSHPSGVEWVTERPPTTVNGDPRISKPGRHDPDESGSQQRDSIRVTVQEAAVLQSFPADYPWRGSKTKQYLQIGNAIPPLLARAVLAAVMRPHAFAEVAWTG